MKKNFSLTKPETGQRVKVELIPLGNKIKYRVIGKVYCTRMNTELPNSKTLDQMDLVWISVFGTRNNVFKFLKQNRKTIKVMYSSMLGYSECDIVK